jgi:hypothetical protein
VDKDQADALANVLRAAEIPVWRDTNQIGPGDEWTLVIRRAIQRNSVAFLACFSKASTSRPQEYQNRELSLAAEIMQERPLGGPVWLIPIRFDDCEIPEYDLGGRRLLSTHLNRIDLFGPDRENSLARLVASVGKLTGNAPQNPAAVRESITTADSEQRGPLLATRLKGLYEFQRGCSRSCC